MKNNNWKSDRSEALFKLIFWLIFILVVYLIMTYGFPASTENNNENTNKVPTEQPIENESKEIDLVKQDFNYTYEVTIEGEKYSFDGKVENNMETGYKQDKDGTIIKYQIRNQEIYQLNNAGEEIITNLYENMQSEFLDYKTLNKILKENECSNLKCEFNYLDYSFIVNKENNANLQVEITKDNINYKLNYIMVN